MYHRPHFHGRAMATFPGTFGEYFGQYADGGCQCFQWRDEQGLEPLHQYLWNSVRHCEAV